MPPKAKYTKGEIVEAALKIVEDKGKDALTARSLGEALNSSPRPIFTVFSSMNEVWSEVYSLARKIYERYEDDAMEGSENPFKGSGIGYIRFASERPRLFRLLFMSELETVPNIDDVLKGLDRYYETIINSVITQYGFCHETAAEIYRHMWIYSHGIASLLVTNVCTFTQEQISDMLNTVASSIIRKFKAEGRK